MPVQIFLPIPKHARLARRYAVHVLDSLGIPAGSELSDSAELIVAELAANAIRHGRPDPRGRFIVAILLDPADGAPGTLRIEVGSSGAGTLTPANIAFPGPAAESGRGLALVRALSRELAVLTDHSTGATVVRADLERAPSTADDTALAHATGR